jgi:two-component system, chemotaxis family, CheB/CheR fusion protein
MMNSESWTGPSRRVLVIEDNIDSANLLRVVLEMNGHEVYIAHNGHDGIKYADEQRPDVIICDIGLPGMDGYEVARTLRANDSLKDTIMIALTGYTRKEDIAHAASAGFNEHLAKPVKLDRIRELVGGPANPPA